MWKTKLVFVFAAALGMAAAQPSDAPGVSVDLSGAALLHRTPVSYPESARAKGVQGSVTLEVALDATGNVADARVLSGPDELRKSALQSVLQWHFAHEAAGMRRQVTIAFQQSAATANSSLTVPPQEELAKAALQRQLNARGVGRTVKSIQILGLPDSLRAELLAKLPIHEGDAISNEAMENAARIVREFDEHLSLTVQPGTGADAVLQILGPSGQATFTPPGAIRVGGNVQQTKLFQMSVAHRSSHENK